RARPHLLAALGARGRPRDIDRRIHERTLPELLAREPLHRDRLAARARPAAAAADLAADRRHRALDGAGAVAGDVVAGIVGVIAQLLVGAVVDVHAVRTLELNVLIVAVVHGNLLVDGVAGRR